MKYLKLFQFFEGRVEDYIKNVDEKTQKIVEDVFNECFYDFYKEYGSKGIFQYGVWAEGFQFANDHFWADIVNTNADYGKLSHTKACQCSILNDNWGTDKKGQLEIFTDENTNNLFKECIENLKRELDNYFDCEIIYPTEIQPTWYQIDILIKII